MRCLRLLPLWLTFFCFCSQVSFAQSQTVPITGTASYGYAQDMNFSITQGLANQGLDVWQAAPDGPDTVANCTPGTMCHISVGVGNCTGFELHPWWYCGGSFDGLMAGNISGGLELTADVYFPDPPAPATGPVTVTGGIDAYELLGDAGDYHVGRLLFSVTVNATGTITVDSVDACCGLIVGVKATYSGTAQVEVAPKPQQYTVTDLGTLGGEWSRAYGINSSGQVVGWADTVGYYSFHAFRTAANSPINRWTDDLGTGGQVSEGAGINDSGQVVGTYKADDSTYRAFRTAANSPINPATDDLGTLGGEGVIAADINDSGQVVGSSFNPRYYYSHAFRTAPNSPINSETDDLGTLGGGESGASAINDSGQVVGSSYIAGNKDVHAFRTAANSPINPATDDLGTLGGTSSFAYGISASGQVVGASWTTGNLTQHAFRTATNRPIDPATDDLGSLGGAYSVATSINASGQVVGWSYTTVAFPHAFLHSGGVMYDLNDRIPAGSSWELQSATAINDAGLIVGYGRHNGVQRGFVLTPIIPYKAVVQPPINADGSSIFKANRGVLPVKFTLTKDDKPTCDLPAATISVTRTAGGTLGVIDEGTYRVTDCQYHYNLAAKELGVGVYRVDISINGIMVGHAVFALK